MQLSMVKLKESHYFNWCKGSSINLNNKNHGKKNNNNKEGLETTSFEYPDSPREQVLVFLTPQRNVLISVIQNRSYLFCSLYFPTCLGAWGFFVVFVFFLCEVLLWNKQFFFYQGNILMIPKNVSCVKHPVRSALDLGQTTASAAHSQGNCLPAQHSTKTSHHHLEKWLYGL